MIKFVSKTAIVIILSVLFWVFVLKIMPAQFTELGGDSAQYIILAQNIAQGGGYEAVNYPQGGFFYHYPPGFPLLLSGLIYFRGENIYLMHFLVALLAYLSLVFVYRMFREYTTGEKAFLATAFLATNSLFILYSTKHILSDVPYLFMSVLTLFFAVRYLRTEKALNSAGFFTLIALLLSYFMRYIGIALFLGLIFLFINNSGGKKKAAFISAGFIVPFALWQILGRVLNPESFSAYSRQFYLIDPYRPYLGTIFTHPGHLILRFIEGANYFYKTIGTVLFPFSTQGASWFYNTVSMAAVLIILFGFWLKLRQDKTCVFNYYFICYIFTIIIWPYREVDRFILPILPFVYFYFIIGLDEILSFLFKDPARFIFCVTAASILTLNVLNLSSQNWMRKLPSSARDFIAMHYWIKENTDKKEVLVSRKPTVSYFYTKHKSVIYPFTPDTEKIWQDFLKNNARYIIVDNFSKATYYYLLPVINKYKDRLKLLHEEGGICLFEVLKR